MQVYRSLKFAGLILLIGLLVSACGGAAPAPAPAETQAEEPAAAAEEAVEEPAPAEEAAEEPAAEEPAEEPAAEADSGAENVLTVAIPGDIETLDPSFGAAEIANTVLKNIYDQPVRYVRQDTGEGYLRADVTQLEGAVWESFELQPDGVTYKIKVRPGMTFVESGEEITAETIKYKFERAFGVAVSDQWVANTAGVFGMDQIQVDGPYELTITLSQPNPLFGPLMRDQDFGIIDPTAIEANATDADPWGTEWAAKNYAGSGEFYVESWTPGSEMVLRANPDYWAGPACFDKVVLKVIPDSAQRALLLSQGAVDIATNLSVDETESLRGTDGVRVLSIPSRNQVMMGLNNEIAPFDNVQVRQALSYAVPYEQIVNDVFQGQGAVAQSSFPSLAQFATPDFWPYSYDPEQAQALLAEAGYPDGFEFTLAIPAGDAEMEGVAVVLQNAFREIGVDMTIDKQAGGPFFQGLAERTHQSWMRAALNYVDDPFYHLFLWYKTDTVINWFNYSNARIDEITDILATELDPDRRAELSREVQEIINNEAPALYVGELNFLLAMRDDLTGFVLEPDHLLSFYEMCRE
ncbi:MAG: ABC transporter substrate-binding protein [Anaerolineae bacterium]|nr:ABC transporter substrate-binding protein [Anaerolineae bacterium]